MKRLDEILGLPVISKADGMRVGTVVGAYLTENGGAIEGLMIEKASWRKKSGYLPIKKADMIGDVSVIVGGIGVTARPPRIQPLTLGQRVVSVDGRRLGLLTNAMIEEDTGKITALEISRGLFDDWTQGRLWVRSFQNGTSQTVVDVDNDGEFSDKEELS